MRTETPDDLRKVVEIGEIPEVSETYAFLNTSYPCLNERGLAIGETTIFGREGLYNPEGMFKIEEIARLMLERCTTPREAIKLAGELIKEYGYGDYGECLTIADAREVWHFEVFGPGPMKKGGVWAAVRIPDDHVGISANFPRIGEIDLRNPDRFMASDNVRQMALDMGWWDPKSGKSFKFWEAYSGEKPFSTREYFLMSTLAPSLHLDRNAPELPFSVKPEKKVSVRDVMKIIRETYSGTDLDMTKNLMVPKSPDSMELVKSPVANPWMSDDTIALFNAIKPGTIESKRTFSVAKCAYSTVIQLRGWLPPSVGAVCWFAFDNPGESARFPHIRRSDRASSFFRDFRPAQVPHGFRRLGFPKSQSAGDAPLGRHQGHHPIGHPGIRGESARGSAHDRKGSASDSRFQGSGQRAVHGQSISDELHKHHRASGYPEVCGTREQVLGNNSSGILEGNTGFPMRCF